MPSLAASSCAGLYRDTTPDIGDCHALCLLNFEHFVGTVGGCGLAALVKDHPAGKCVPYIHLEPSIGKQLGLKQFGRMALAGLSSNID